VQSPIWHRYRQAMLIGSNRLRWCGRVLSKDENDQMDHCVFMKCGVKPGSRSKITWKDVDDKWRKLINSNQPDR